MARRPIDIFDGVQIPSTVIGRDHATLSGKHHGGVVEQSVSAAVIGEIHGSLTAESGTQVVISGAIHGSVHAESGAEVVIERDLHGSVHVQLGGTVELAPTGTIRGSSHNQGRLVIRGTFGETMTGDGEAVIDPAASIKEPIVNDRVTITSGTTRRGDMNAGSTTGSLHDERSYGKDPYPPLG
jgi:cytoskeletal protein CcmA (bactofilin family)